MRQIKKRNGKVVHFDEQKIKTAIYKAFLDEEFRKNGEYIYIKNASNYADEITERVVRRIERDFGEDEIISVEDIQDIVEDMLMKSRFKDVARSYIRYRNKRELSRNKFIDNQKKFIKKVEEITFEESEKNNDKRENANVNGNTAMGMMLQYGSSLSKEFATTHILKEEHSKAHTSGDIHIHDLDFLPIGTTTCLNLDLEKLFKNGFSTGHGQIREPQSVMSYAALTAVVIQANQNEQHGGQAVNSFDFYMSPGVIKTFKKELKRYILDFLDFYIDSDIEKYKLEGILNHIDIHVENIEISKNILNELVTKIMILGVPEKEAIKIINKANEKALNSTDKQTYQAMESLIHNLNTMNSRAGAQIPFSSINFGTDTSPEGRMVSKNLLLAMDAGLGNGETAIFPILIFKVKEGVNYNSEDPNYDLFKLAIKVSAKRLFPNFSFLDAPFNLEYYKEGDHHTEVGYMGCRTRVMSNVNGKETSTSRGNLSFTSINLPRLGLKHGKILNNETNIEAFYNELDVLLDLTKDQLLDRFEYQGKKKVKNSPFLMGQGMWMDSEKLNPEDTLKEVLKHGTLTMGFIGLAECLVALTGEHHGESEKSQELGLEIIGHMRKRLDEYTKEYGLNFSLIATPAEGLSGRFVKLDKELYGEIEGITDKEYYTNSFHIPVYYDITAYEKIKLEAPYHNLCNGGHISYVELDGDPLNNLEAFEKIVRLMKESGVGYGSINHPVDMDPVCGYTGIIGDICPKCGREEGDVKFHRIRRITGYLVGTLDRFNDAKKAEEHDRVKHM